MFTKEELIEVIRAATKTLTICVPDMDYYARKTDFTTTEISFVDPEALIAALAPEQSLAKVPDQKWTKNEMRVVAIVADQLGIEIDTIARDTQPVRDLGIDSLDLIYLTMAVEDEFDIEIPDEETYKMVTVQDILNYLLKKKS